MCTPVGSSASEWRLPIWTVSGSAGCSIARSQGRRCRDTFRPTTILCFASSLAGNPPKLEIDEIKTIPSTPRSDAFVERLIGTIRREYLDRIWFWNQSDLERKLEAYKAFYNHYRCHTALAGITPAQRN